MSFKWKRGTAWKGQSLYFFFSTFQNSDPRHVLTVPLFKFLNQDSRANGWNTVVNIGRSQKDGENEPTNILSFLLKDSISADIISSMSELP